MQQLREEKKAQDAEFELAAVANQIYNKELLGQIAAGEVKVEKLESAGGAKFKIKLSTPNKVGKTKESVLAEQRAHTAWKTLKNYFDKKKRTSKGLLETTSSRSETSFQSSNVEWKESVRM